ncbi:MAG: CaiB/BaiF CoA transferase family protein, partial [Tepidiformaceae bacterium]
MPDPVVNPLPLSRFRILDCSTVLAGPLAATFLAEFGADVVKIELPPSPDYHMPVGRLQEERNKRSVAIDLRRPEGQELLLRLVETADALVENFRPGTLERWNLGPDVLLARNPNLIIHRLSAFGQTGPWRTRTGYDRQAQAISGATWVTGLPDSEPVRSGFAVADYLAGIWGAFSILVAAYWRDARGGTGQVSDLALFEPIFRASESSLVAYALTGEVRGRTGNTNPHVVPAKNFATSDGVILAVNANNDRQWARLARMVGRDDLAGDDAYRGPRRRLHAEEIYGILDDWFGQHTLEQAESALANADVPFAPIHSIADIAEHPLFKARATVDVPLRDGSTVPMVGVFPRLSKSPE